MSCIQYVFFVSRSWEASLRNVTERKSRSTRTVFEALFHQSAVVAGLRGNGNLMAHYFLV